ncbi:hypothetical protein E1301_Tti005216 [Triplophysa tibetana]|uniref:Uncharacterized protein n=1 Tax=Triplophysa tibetana TaxID=1572043 RepID=A0A5A9PQQ7_9TELE|nr:hypothetical protein E1301_Tti005216 [Triplophysa tibetana]
MLQGENAFQFSTRAFFQYSLLKNYYQDPFARWLIISEEMEQSLKTKLKESNIQSKLQKLQMNPRMSSSSEYLDVANSVHSANLQVRLVVVLTLNTVPQYTDPRDSARTEI